MNSLMNMRTCTRVAGAARYYATAKRNAGFWAAVAQQHTAEAKEKFVTRINSNTSLDYNEKQKAIAAFDKPDLELGKLGFWSGLKKIYSEAKKEVEEDLKNPPVPRATADREQRRRDLDENDIVPGTPEFFKFYEGHQQSELALETGVPDECIDDPQLHIAMLKFNRLKEFYKINTEAEEKAFVEKFNISAGVQTLEAAFLGPIPEHTFTELPIIKEPEAGHGHH